MHMVRPRCPSYYSASAKTITVTKVGFFGGCANRECLAFVAEPNLILPIATSTITFLRFSWFNLLFGGVGRRSLTLAGTYGVAVT